MKNIVCYTVVVFAFFVFPANAKEKSKQFFFEIGTSFGGDEIAQNNNGGLGGDDYKAGGGAVLGLGAKFNLSEKFLGQGLAAYRYQGGDGSNSGVVLEGAALYKLNDAVSLGFGLHADLNSKTKTAFGESIKFENAVGPMILLDWVIDPRYSLGAKYIAIDYETDNGAEVEGDQLAVYVQFKF